MEDKANGQEPVAVNPATDKVQDPALNPEQVVSPVPDVKTEGDEHGEGSRLGRKLKRLEEQLYEMSSKLEESMSRSMPDPDTVFRTPNPEPLKDDTPEFINTREDVDKVIDYRMKKMAYMREAYQSGYVNTLQKLGEINTELHGEVLREMQENPRFNSMETRNPIIDARINYAEAKAAVLAKRTATPQTSNPNPLPTGVSSTNRNTMNVSSAKEPLKLSPEAEEFKKIMGMSDDEVREALSKSKGMVKTLAFS